MHALFGIDLPGPRRGPSLTSRVRTRLRRLRYWLAQFAWFGIFAVLTALTTVGLSLADRPLHVITATGFLAVVLAVLSTKET